MYLNKHEGNADSFQTGHQSSTLKAKHHCSRCSKSFQFAFQLRSHLRCHLLKSPSAYIHDMKNYQNDSASQFRLLNEETIENDDADHTLSNWEGLSSRKKSFDVDKSLTSNSETGLVISKCEHVNSQFTGIQGRKRKSGQTLAEICGKLQKSKSLKIFPTSLSTSAVSSNILTDSAEQAIENPLECNGSEKRNSQSVSEYESQVESYKQHQGSTNSVQNVLCDDAAQGVNLTEKHCTAQQVDKTLKASASTSTASLPQNVKCTDAVTNHDDASAYDKHKNKAQNTNLQERVNSDNLFKTSQKHVTLGDVHSAEPVVTLTEPAIPLTDSSEVQKSLSSQADTTKRFTCPTCGLSYSKNSGLALHLLAHKRREMVIKFKKKALSKSVNVPSGMHLGSSFTDTSKEDQITESQPECLTKESTSTITGLRSDISEEESVKSLTPSSSSALKRGFKKSLKRKCNIKCSESQYSSPETTGNSKVLHLENTASQNLSENKVCHGQCEATGNSRSTPLELEDDLKEESSVTECSDFAHTPSVLQKTRKCLNKQMHLSTGENITAKQKSPEKSYYKKKMEVIPCQYCYALVSKRNMSRHRSIHCPVLTLPCYTKAKCHICMMTLLSQELAHHLEVVHGQGVMRVRSCNVCFKGGFESFIALQKHKKEHFLNIKDIDLRPHEVYDRSLPGCGSVCPFCNTETLSASNIRAHIVSHMVDKDCTRNQLRKGDKFGCPVCLKSFGLNTRIENHILSHWKIKLYECPSCLKQFTRYDTMGRHCAIKHKTDITSELSDATKSLDLPAYTTKTEAITADDQSDM